MKRVEGQAGASRLAVLMFTIGRSMRERFHRNARTKSARSLLHLQTLRYVKEKKRPLMRDVAKFLFITPPAATLLINGLVRERLLARIVDAKDRRAVRLRITREGNDLFTRSRNEMTREVANVFSVLDQSEQNELVHLLEKVARSK